MGFRTSTSGVRLGRRTRHRRRDLRRGRVRPDRSTADDSAHVAGVRRRRPARVPRSWPERRPRTCTPRRAAWRRRLTPWPARARTAAVACLDGSTAASSELKRPPGGCDRLRIQPQPRRRDRRSMVRGTVPLRTEDLIETENAERRCSVCHSGRGSRRFEVVCPTGREPVVVCGNCRARFGDDPPIGRQPAHPSEPVRAAAEPPAPPEQRQPDQRPDRLRAALSELPGSFSTAMAARAAGMNSDKALARLEELERSGDVRRVGKRWSTESPPSELAAAMDRLQAQTSNVRIVRERAPVG